MSTRIRITAITAIGDGAGNRYRTGQVVDVADDLAAAWVKAGHAVKTGKANDSDTTQRPEPPAAVEATNEPPATTAGRARKSRKSDSND